MHILLSQANDTSFKSGQGGRVGGQTKYSVMLIVEGTPMQAQDYLKNISLKIMGLACMVPPPHCPGSSSHCPGTHSPFVRDPLPIIPMQEKQNVQMGNNFKNANFFTA